MKKHEGYRDVFAELSDCILLGGAYKATKYISEKLTIKATRKLVNGKIDKIYHAAEIIFTIGGPNYEERQFIKKAKATKITFPIDGIVVKYPK